MSFNTSNEFFNEIFGSSNRKKGSDISQTLQELSDYLISKKHNALCIEMGEYIRSGGKVSGFTCREDVLFDLAETLSINEIPFAFLSSDLGRTGVLIREGDSANVMQLTDILLKKKAHICALVDGEYFEKSFKKSSNSDSIVAISNLSREEVGMFKTLLRKEREYTCLGVNKYKDNTYTLFVPAKEFLDFKGMELGFFYKLILINTIKLEGGNKKKNQALEELKDDFENALASDFSELKMNLDNTPLWVVGKGHQYIRINDSGYEYGRCTTKDDKLLFTAMKNSTADKNDYIEELTSLCQRIEHKMITSDFSEVENHFLKKENIDDFLDNTYSIEEKLCEKGEEKLADLIHEMLTKKLINNQEMHNLNSYNSKISLYTREAAKIFGTIKTGNFPEGYSKGDYHRMIDVIKTYQLDFTEYDKVEKRLKNYAIAPTEKIHVVNQDNRTEKLIGREQNISEQKIDIPVNAVSR